MSFLHLWPDWTRQKKATRLCQKIVPSPGKSWNSNQFATWIFSGFGVVFLKKVIIPGEPVEDAENAENYWECEAVALHWPSPTSKFMQMQSVLQLLSSKSQGNEHRTYSLISSVAKITGTQCGELCREPGNLQVRNGQLKGQRGRQVAPALRFPGQFWLRHRQEKAPFDFLVHALPSGNSLKESNLVHWDLNKICQQTISKCL